MANNSKQGVYKDTPNVLTIAANGVINYLPGATVQANGVAQALVKRVTVALAGAADTGGGIGAWQNPEAGAISVLRLTVSSEGSGGVVATAACNIDAGTTATGATTLSDNLIDGADIHAALATFDNLANPGANGKARQSLAAGKWVTFSTGDAGASAGFVGEAIIEYLVL